MGKMIERVNAGLHSLQSFADRRESQKKVNALSAMTIFILVLAIITAIWMVVHVEVFSFIFELAVAALAGLGFHASRKRQRPLLGLYALGMAVVVCWSVISLIFGLLFNLLFLSLDVVGFVFAVVILVVEGFSVLFAYSLYKDLDPKRVVTLGAPHDGSPLEEDEAHDFALAEDGAMFVDSTKHESMTTAAPPVYQQTPTFAGTMPVYNPATGTYGGHVQAAYSPYGAPQVAYSTQPYGYPLNVVPSVSPAPSVAQPATGGNMFEFAASESRPVYENDIIGSAAPAGATQPAPFVIDDGEFDPFKEKSGGQ